MKVLRDKSSGQAVAVSGDGKRMAVGSRGGFVEVVDLASGKTTNSWQGHSDHISALALSPDGTRLACGTDSGGTVRIWDVATAKELVPPGRGHQAAVTRLAVLKDGTLVSHDNGWLLGRWDPTTGKPEAFREWPWPKYLSPHWAYSPAADRTLVGNQSLYLGADPTDPKDTYVDVFAEAKPPREGGRKEVETLGNGNRIYTVALSADGKRGAVATGDDRVIVCDLDPIKYVRTLTLPEVRHLAWTRQYSLALSPDGGVLAGASQDKVQLWDVRTGEPRPAPKIRFHAPHMAFSPDGKLLALAGYKEVILWDMGTSQVRKVIALKENGVRSIAFSPDGTTLATGSLEYADVVRLWDVATGKEVRQLRGARGGAASLAFSPDGKTLYAGTGSSLIVGWDLSDR